LAPVSGIYLIFNSAGEEQGRNPNQLFISD